MNISIEKIMKTGSQQEKLLAMILCELAMIRQQANVSQQEHEQITDKPKTKQQGFWARLFGGKK